MKYWWTPLKISLATIGSGIVKSMGGTMDLSGGITELGGGMIIYNMIWYDLDMSLYNM